MNGIRAIRAGKLEFTASGAILLADKTEPLRGGLGPRLPPQLFGSDGIAEGDVSLRHEGRPLLAVVRLPAPWEPLWPDHS